VTAVTYQTTIGGLPYKSATRSSIAAEGAGGE
jgi:hypothetical protein